MKVFRLPRGQPIIDIKKTSEELRISFNATSNAVNKLIQLGILRQTENVQRNRVFAYERVFKHSTQRHLAKAPD